MAVADVFTKKKIQHARLYSNVNFIRYIEMCPAYDELALIRMPFDR